LDTQIAGFHGNMMEYGQHVSSFLTHHFHFGLKRNRQFAIWIFFLQIPSVPRQAVPGSLSADQKLGEAWLIQKWLCGQMGTIYPPRHGVFFFRENL
jgi:hypothetical protein